MGIQVLKAIILFVLHLLEEKKRKQSRKKKPIVDLDNEIEERVC